MTIDLSGIRAVAVDVDGTIAGGDHQVSRRTSAALNALQERGFVVVVVTGRARRSALDIAREAGIQAPVVAINGAVVSDPTTEEDLSVATMPHEIVIGMRSQAEELGLEFSWWTSREMRLDRDGSMRVRLGEMNAAMPVVADPYDIEPDTITKAMYHAPEEVLDRHQELIYRSYPEIARGMYDFFELAPENVSKWSGLADILASSGISPRECLGFGDGGNDVPWLSQIGLPVAMENARDEVKAIASMVIGHHADDAVAAFIETQILAP